MLPAFCHGITITPGFKHLATDLAGLRAAEPGHQCGNPFGVAALQLLGCPFAQAFGHAGGGARCDGIDGDAIALQFTRGDDGKTCDACLGGRVICLAYVAEQPRVRGGVDDACIDRFTGLALLAPVVARVMRWCKSALEVDLDDGVPVFLAHVDHHAVTQYACVVDQDVQAAE